MTNSETQMPKDDIGTEAPTSLADAKYASDKGTVFDIIQLPNNHFRIIMKKGGKAPRICDGTYTGYNLAQKELVKYLRQTNRLGDAIYPKRIGR